MTRIMPDQDNGTVRHVEEWINAPDGTAIYTKTWKSVTEPPVATVVFVHGFGEHINRYDYEFDKFARAGIEVYSFDQRGFGRTGERHKSFGVNGGWKVLTADIANALNSKRRKGIPQFLFGHSMGGGLTLNYACRGPEREKISGFLASAPMVSLAPESKRSELVVQLVNLGAKILPSFQVTLAMNAEYMSHDPAERAKYASDPLINSTISLRCASDMVMWPRSMFKEHYKKLTQPIYMTHGTADPVTAYSVSKEFYEKIPSEDKTFKPWDGLFHELHNEFEKDQVIQEYIDWILLRSESITTQK